MMRSTTPRDEPARPLDESNYELVGLSDSLIELTSDDDAHTESIASTDGPTPDDASVVSDDENEYGSVDRELDDSVTAAEHATSRVHSHFSPYQSSLDDSNHTDVPAYSQSRDRMDTLNLKLSEELVSAPNTIQASQVVRSFQQQSGSWYPVFDQYGCSEVRLVVKAGLSQDPIPTPETYKIWYLGEPDKWLENKISSQIAAALTAYPSTSRSVMVQGQLEPYGPIISAHWCIRAQVPTKSPKSSDVLLTFESGEEVMLRSDVASSRQDRPDLVVVNHPTIPASTADQQDFTAACRFFQREGVPCLELVAARCYGQGSVHYDSKSLVACVEGRIDPEMDFELQEVLLLDHYTFCELDPRQLNRHLALISPHLLSSSAPAGKKSRHAQSGTRWRSRVTSILANHPTTINFTLIFLSIIGLMVLHPLFISYVHRISSDSIPNTVTRLPIETASTLTPSSLTATSKTIASITPISTIDVPPKGLTILPHQPRKSKKNFDKCRKKTAEVFEIEATGDYQFVLRPIENVRNNRKKPQLQIRVAHDSEAVPIRFNRTVSGAYVIDFEHQYPHGTFNVSISTFSRPLVQQSFEIMLGHNKSTAVQLVDAALARFESAQGQLRGAAKKAMVKMHDLESTAVQWVNHVRQTDSPVTVRLHQLKCQAAVNVEMVKKMRDVTWLTIREATAPVRTSESMLKARINALRIRCQLERITGLSKNTPKGQQSWACSKVRN